MTTISSMDEYAILRVRLTPKGGRDALSKYEAGVLTARVAAAPVDGAGRAHAHEATATSANGNIKERRKRIAIQLSLRSATIIGVFMSSTQWYVFDDSIPVHTERH